MSILWSAQVLFILSARRRDLREEEDLDGECKGHMERDDNDEQDLGCFHVRGVEHRVPENESAKER